MINDQVQNPAPQPAKRAKTTLHSFFSPQTPEQQDAQRRREKKEEENFQLSKAKKDDMEKMKKRWDIEFQNNPSSGPLRKEHG